MDTSTWHIALLCNPLAGSGRAVPLARQIAGLLEEKGISHRLFTEQWPERFTGFTDVWIVGGDGTLNYYLNHYPFSESVLGVFAGGTGNDFHWLLYGKRSVEEQLAYMLAAEPRPVDVGRCNDRYFLNGLGIGFEGAVARALTGKKKRPGKTSFFLAVLQKIFTYRSRHYDILADGESIRGRKLLVDLSNGRRAGGGFHIAPAAAADDGLLDLVMAEALPPLLRLKYLPLIEKGKHLFLKPILHRQVREVKVQCEGPVGYHIDGEYGEAEHFEIGILKAVLRVRG